MRTTPLLLTATALLILVHTPAIAQLALSWSGPLAEGTRITVHDLFDDRPGAPGPVVFDGQTPPSQPDVANAIRVVFGDAPHLHLCRTKVLQDPLERLGADAVFSARLGPFTAADTIGVFFVWDHSQQDEAYDPLSSVFPGAGRQAPEPDPGPPGVPGRPTFTGG